MDATDCSTATQVRVDAGRADGSGACAFFRRARFLPFFSADGGRPLFFLGFRLGVCGLDPRVGAVDEVPDTVADTGGMRDAHAETTDAVLVAEGEQVAGEPPGPRSPRPSISLYAAKNAGEPICSSCGAGICTTAPDDLFGWPGLNAGAGSKARGAVNLLRALGGATSDLGGMWGRGKASAAIRTAAPCPLAAIGGRAAGAGVATGRGGTGGIRGPGIVRGGVSRHKSAMVGCGCECVGLCVQWGHVCVTTRTPP